MDDHVERSRSGMTDADILKRIKEGTLLIDNLGRFVISYFGDNATYLKIWERERNGSTYRFVQICHKGKKKKITVHRLVWIANERKLVPPDMDVDHIKGKDVPFPDSFLNLRLLPVTVNRSRIEVPLEGNPF